MNILMVSAEASPLAKVGGLADVASALPKALRKRGNDARLIIPAYKMILEQTQWPVSLLFSGIRVEMSPGWVKYADVYTLDLDGLPVYLIGTDEWFHDADRSERIYRSGGDHYLFFAQAVLNTMRVLDWVPDVIHCNDWHTGFLPVIMREKERFEWSKTGIVFSVHNLAYQGHFGREVLDKLALPHHLYNAHQLETFGGVNFLKAGMVYSDQVCTVSPRYSREILTDEFGCDLHGFMKHLDSQGRLTGILNGIDHEEFNPATDPHLAKNYSAKSPAGKSACRQALYKEVGLPHLDGKSLIGLVSRLSHQKGMDLVLDSSEAILENSQLIVLGAGDSEISSQFRQLQSRFPDRVAFFEGYSVELAPRIYAGSDLFLMPSAFEPCGLGQMIAMRYGTVPIVRETGGLADTVKDGHNGFSFKDKAPHALQHAVQRAHAAWLEKAAWANLVQNCLTQENDWSRSAREYETLYNKTVERKADALRLEA